MCHKDPVQVQVSVPDIATKQLKFRTVGKRRILTISSNFLTFFGFSKGDRIIERSRGVGKGIVIERVGELELDLNGTKSIYGRTYKRRKNNPFETVLETSSQRLIDEAFPKHAERVHVLFEKGRVTVTPVITVSERAKANALQAHPESVFAALTSGVDLTSLRSQGFSISAILEMRPQEARDKTDLTETGMLSAMANSGPVRACFNEDITNCSLDIIGREMAKNKVFTIHASPQCDDLSSVKARSLKEKHHEDGTSTEDMVIDLLNIIEKVAPPIVILENVTGFLKSPAFYIARLRMKRWGYRCHEHTGDARDYGGLSSRKRAYVVFTCLDEEFLFEGPSSPREKAVWRYVEPYLGECRDVSHSKALQDGKRVGRLRSIKPDSKSCPTPLKSQSHMAKDSLVIEPEEGVFKWPSEGLLARILGIENIDLNAVSSTIASEIIGQSVDIAHHSMVIRSIKRHINSWCSRFRPNTGICIKTTG